MMILLSRLPAPDRRRGAGARFAAAAAASLVLHAGAAAVAAAPPEHPAGGRVQTAMGPLETRIAPKADSAGPATDSRGGAAKPAFVTAPDSTYYKRSQLDAGPHIVTKIEPAYPAGVPPTGGKARIRLFINERGAVDRVAVVESAPVARFGEAAAEAFKTARFAPGKRAGGVVKSQILIEVEFHPLGSSPKN